MNIYWSFSEQKLVKALTSPVEVSAMSFVLRDVTPVALYLCERQASDTTPYAVTSVTSGHHIEFGAKKALTDTAYLSQQAAWASAGSGTTQHYLGNFPLDGADLIAALAGVTSLLLYAEFTSVETATGKNFCSTRFEITILPDVIRGTES